MRTIFWTHQNFCKRNETSKIPSTSFGGCKNFVRRENPLFLDIHPSLGHQISQHMDYEANVTVWLPATFNWARWIRHRSNIDPWYFNYYGSQCYQDQDQGNQSYYDSQIATQQQYFLHWVSIAANSSGFTIHLHPLNTASTSVTSTEDQTTVAATGSTENTKKGTKRKNAKYETFPFKTCHDILMVNWSNY